MYMIKVAFFDTKEYDRKLFDEYNKNYGYEITYLESKLNKETIKILKECGVKLIALRCC